MLGNDEEVDGGANRWQKMIHLSSATGMVRSFINNINLFKHDKKISLVWASEFIFSCTISIHFHLKFYLIFLKN